MKKFLAMLLALGMLVSLAACGGGDEPDLPVDPPTDAPVELPAEDPAEENPAEDSPFLGAWEMAEGFLGVYEDGTFNITDGEGWILSSGTWNGDDGLLLTFDGGDTAFFVLDDEGNLYGGEDYGTLYPVFRWEEPEDLPNGYVDSAFVDIWYLFGDLSRESLWIFDDGTFQAVSAWQEDGLGQFIVCEGIVSGDTESGLYMSDNYGEKFGYATLEGDELTLTLEVGYAYFLEYEGDMVFDRESRSMALEGQPLEEGFSNAVLVGEWLYSAHENILEFYEDGTFRWTTAYGVDEGSYTFDGERVTLFQDGSPVAYGILDTQGILYLDEETDYYYKNEDAV